jgi:xanthine dehydrogenase accessory factor
MMSNPFFAAFYSNDARSLAVVLGTNEIASAVAVRLLRSRFSVVMSHDSFPPVIRRGMAFHDALYGDKAMVEEIEGERAETMLEIAAAVMKPNCVAVTPLHLTDLLAIRSPSVIVDARMQKHRVTPDYRGIVRLAVGLGPNFAVGVNCDIAIETHPAKTGKIVKSGATEAADGMARQLGAVGRERFVYSDHAGLWHTPVDIGMRVFKGFLLGYLDGTPVHAPIDGILRGIARDATRIPAGVKLVEIDARGRRAAWKGTDERGRAIADATIEAIQMRAARQGMVEAVTNPAVC